MISDSSEFVITWHTQYAVFSSEWAAKNTCWQTDDEVKESCAQTNKDPMSLESEWDNAHETVDYIASFVLKRVLLFVKIAELRRFHTTAGAAGGPRAKQIYSEIQTGPRSIVIRSLISFTPLKFVYLARFTPVIPRWGYFSRTEMSKVEHDSRQSPDSSRIQAAVLTRGTVFFPPSFGSPGSCKSNGSFANMARRAWATWL